MKPKHEAQRSRVLLNYKIWLSNIAGEGILGEGKYKLLRTIEEKGSLAAAADVLGLSYRKAWGDIKKAEELLGYELTDKYRGGKDGGQSTLTPRAKQLLEAYEALHKRLDDEVENAFEEFRSKLPKRDDDE